jgi:hypothetical protein
MNHGSTSQTTSLLQTMTLTLSGLRQIVFKAEAKYGPDVPVVIIDEESCIEEGFDNCLQLGISDVRIIPNWPLPGVSIMHNEGEQKVSFAIFERHIAELSPSDD